MLMHVGIGLWLLGPLVAVFVCPDTFTFVHLVEGPSQCVCLELLSVKLNATWPVAAYSADLSCWLQLP